MKKYTLLWGAVILAVLLPVSNAGVLNGGFELTDNGYSETLTPVDWTNVGHIDGVIAYSIFGTPAYDGSYYYDLGGYGGALPASGDGIEQTVTTAIGTQYTLTFGLSGENAANSTESLNVLINGSLVQSFSVVYNGAYNSFQDPFVTQTLNYTATSTSSTILFTVTGASLGSNDPLIDGISFNASTNATTPEPATWLTGLLGLGVAALRYRKSGRKATVGC
jgi:hypothetical protein